MNSQKIVITGSTKGLGFAFALKFLELGDEVVISSRNKNLSERITQILNKKYPTKVFGTVADVSKYEDMKHLAEYAVSKLGHIDIWINNAGMAPTSLKEFHELEPDSIEATIDTNILGTLYGMHAAISVMKERGGMIYNLEGFGSDGSIRKGMQVYGTTKNAIAYIRKALSLEYKGTGMGFCSIQPGMAVTNLITGEPGTKFSKNTYWVFNVIADQVENIANKIVPMIKLNTKGNKVFKYSSTWKTIWKFLTSWRFKDRFFDNEGNLKIQKIEDRILQED